MMAESKMKKNDGELNKKKFNSISKKPLFFKGNQ
jgi:hypothetical protein